jgi:hypothetical protein
MPDIPLRDRERLHEHKESGYASHQQKGASVTNCDCDE